MKRSPVLLCALVLVLMLSATLAMGAATIRETFSVAAGGTIDVDTEIGSIEVRATSSDTVEVEVQRSGRRADDVEVAFSQSGDTVAVVGEYSRSWSWGNGPKVRFLITVPSRFNVDLKTAGGSISVSDIEGSAQVKTSGGSLKLGNIDGEIWGRTSGGSIKVDGCSGRADVHTSGGSVRVGDVSGVLKIHTSGGSITVDRARASVDAETSGGSITVHEVAGDIRASSSGGSVTAYISEQPQGDCKLTTSGGTVTAYLAEDLALDISAHAGSRKVKTDFALDAAKLTKRSLTGQLNGGGPELYLRTSGGGVKILRK